MTARRMKAAVLYGKEDVRIESVEVPALGPGEVLLRTMAALTCGTDAKVYRRGYHARMIVPPSVFGHEVSGIVEEVGAGVEGLEPGTPVVVANSAPCGSCEFCRRGRESLCDDLLFWNGAYAELARIPARVVAKNLLRLPPGLDFSAAALTEPLACVVRGAEECRVSAGQSVAVIGVGPIGQMLVAVCALRGAAVTAVGRNPERLAAAREAGAATLVSADPDGGLDRQILEVSPDGRGFEVVIEAAGHLETSEAALLAVRKGGVVNLFAGCPSGTHLALEAHRLHYEEVRITSTFHHTPASFRESLELIAARRLDPMRFVTGSAPLERLPDILAEMGREGGLKTAIVPAGA
jgi:L-iditol 2-dehydrogenase